MNFKKKFDHNNINNYLPDNRTIAMSEFFQKKFEGLPSYICDMMEAKSRIEYDDYDTEIILKLIRDRQKEENKKLIDEYNEIVKQSEEASSEEIDLNDDDNNSK
jgi:hypothetical protein